MIKGLTLTECFRLAAFAANVPCPKENSPWEWVNQGGIYTSTSVDGSTCKIWNPIENSGQAFELTVWLRITLPERKLTVKQAQAYVFEKAVEAGLAKLDGALRK